MDGDEPIGLLIGAVRRRIKQAVGSRVRRYHLTTQQFWVLVAIHERPGLSLGELAAHLRMDKPTASRVVFALLKRKLVEVKTDAADRRRARLRLGPLGAPLGEELHALAATVRAAVVRGLSTAELTALRVSLRKIIANMDHVQHNGAGEIPVQMSDRLVQRRRAH
jgi:DNA-binding MarR family transcriptional regulator